MSSRSLCLLHVIGGLQRGSGARILCAGFWIQAATSKQVRCRVFGLLALDMQSPPGLAREGEEKGMKPAERRASFLRGLRRTSSFFQGPLWTVQVIGA